MASLDEGDKSGLWVAMRALAEAFELEERMGTGAGIILNPQYGEELAHATLQLGDDGLLWLGLVDGRKLVEPQNN